MPRTGQPARPIQGQAGSPSDAHMDRNLLCASKRDRVPMFMDGATHACIEDGGAEHNCIAEKRIEQSSKQWKA